MFETTIIRDMYDHPGAQTSIVRPVRKWQDRPALSVGQPVTIVRVRLEMGRYIMECRILVRTESGVERWVDETKVAPVEHDGNASAYARMGEIASAMLANGN